MLASEKNIVAVSVACCVDALQSVDCYDKALCKCSTANFGTQSYYTNALYKCSATKFETQSYYTNALYKCNTIVLLNKALLQGVPSQFMQLLDLKHNLNSKPNLPLFVHLIAK